MFVDDVDVGTGWIIFNASEKEITIVMVGLSVNTHNNGSPHYLCWFKKYCIGLLLQTFLFIVYDMFPTWMNCNFFNTSCPPPPINLQVLLFNCTILLPCWCLLLISSCWLPFLFVAFCYQIHFRQCQQYLPVNGWCFEGGGGECILIQWKIGGKVHWLF